MPKQRVCDATVVVLRRTDNPAVMWGDVGLLHAIAAELGWEHNAWHTEDRVLKALHKTPGPLIKRPTIGWRGRRMIRFLLPECAD